MRLDQNRQENIKKFVVRALGVSFRDQGRDFSGWDCWGLILQAYRCFFGLELPDLAQVSALDTVQASSLFTVHARAWHEVEQGRERAGDVALFRRGRWPCHVGLVIKKGQVLHVDSELRETFIEPFDRGLLRQRLVGIYRHEQLASG